MLKAAVFDYDGVIVDSFPSVFGVYKTICEELDVRYPEDIDEFRKIYGRNHLECHENLGIKLKDYGRVEKIFRREIIKKNPPLFPDIASVVKKLSESYRLALVSNNFKKEIKSKLKLFGLKKYFSLISAREDHQIYSHEHSHRQFIKSEAITNTLAELEIKPEESIYIGDMIGDYRSGVKAGLDKVIIVDYGWGYIKEEIPPQLFSVKKPKDIIKAVKLLDR